MSNPTTSLQMYPRGFLGRPTSTNDEPLTMSARTPNLMFGFQVVSGGANPDAGNPQVDALLQSYLGDRRYAIRWDCFNDTLTATLSAFGVSHFGAWLFAQQRSTQYSALHANFLVDTCQFLRTGRRRVGIYNWQGMFRHHWAVGHKTYGGRHTEGNTPLELGETNGVQNARLFKTFEGMDMGDTFAAWIKHPGGMEDLLQSLFLLFGSSTDN